MRRSTLIFAFLFLTLLAWTQNVTVSGALVGNGSYPTLTAAFAAINAGSQTGATITVSILANTNEGGSTAILNAGTWTALNVVPSGGPRSVVGATQPGQALVALNGADKVTFNGQLAGGVRGLTLENTTASNVSGTCTVALYSDATLNTFTYCQILGSSQTAEITPGATVRFAPGQATVGNDNNTFSYCDIGASGTNLPSKALFSQGDPLNYNSGNLITNCNIYDYFRPNLNSNGIVLYHGNLNWTIRLNRFYQTGPRLNTGAAYHRDILLNSFLGNYGHSIDGNTFGYGNSAGTGLSSFRASIVGSYYVPIDVPAADDFGASSITNNVIAGISFPALSGADQPINFTGIDIGDGIWSVSGNTIGSSTVAGSIGLTNQGGSVIVRGIDVFVGPGGVNVTNNTIGGLQLDALTGASISFTGIKGYNIQTINYNNIIGNQIGFAAAPIVVNGDAVSDRVIGIDFQGPDHTLTNNTVAYLSSRTSNPGISVAAGVIGILAQGIGTLDISDLNKVIALESTHASAAVTVIGIMEVAVEATRRNLVHSLSALSPNAKIEGIHLGTTTPGLHANNMVRLGYDRWGQSLPNGISIIGIYEDAGFHEFVFNSVYIGGNNVSGTANTYAFYGIGGNNNRRWRSNIYFNARSNGSGTGRHYACYNTIAVPGLGPNSAGNDFYVSGNGGMLGHIFGQDVLTLPAWLSLTGDIGSICSNPNFINPDGSALTGDLHIGPISPIEAVGMPFSTLTTDYDNQARSGLTPVDIGADAVIAQAQAQQIPEIVLTGNGQLLVDGDTAASVADGTDFGAGNCNAQQPHAFVLQNTGAAPLLISSYGLTGPGAAQFSVVVAPPGVIAPGQSATFSLAYTASVSGPATAQFNLSCNDWDETFYNFAVQGSSVGGDTVPPVAVCQTLNLYVGSGGTVGVGAQAVAAGSTDNCGISSYTATPSTFSCNQLGLQSVLVQVADYVGQTDACSTTVMVLDSTRPMALCRTFNAILDMSGQAVLLQTAFDNGSSDNCGIDSLWASATQFDCSDLGLNVVTLSVRDASGNVGTCTSQLTVLDLQAPHVTCQNTTVSVGTSGSTPLNVALVLAASSDNCGIDTLYLSHTSVTCADAGVVPVLVSAVDIHGNLATCTAQVTVQAVPLGVGIVPPATDACGHHIPCAGMSVDSVAALASGGCAPYTYAWSNGQTGEVATSLGAGVHSVTVTSANGQQQVQSITLTAPAPLLAGAIGTPSCFGNNTGSATATGSGGQACQAYSYLWSNGATTAGITGLAPGTYQLSVTDAAGCMDTASVVVGTLAASFVAITQNLQTLFASPGFVAYQWQDSLGPIAGATSGQFTPTVSGLYSVVVTDSNGCMWTSVGFPFTYVGAADALPGWSDIRLYPNPGRGVFQFALGQAIEGPLWLSVTDLSGRVLYQEALAVLEGGRIFDLSVVAAGVYVVELRGAEGQAIHFRLLRE